MKENVFKYVYRIENQYFIIIFFAQNVGTGYVDALNGHVR